MSVPGYKHIPGVPFAVPADMPEEEVAAMRNYFSQQAEAEARRFNTGTDLTRENYRNQAGMNAANNAARLREAAMQIKADRYRFDQQFGLDTQKFGETKREFDLGYGLDRDRLGADVLFKGASLRGPLDAFQGASYARGVEGGGLAPYLQGLTTSGTTAFGGGTATSGNPVPLTTGTMANELTGQQGTSLSGGLTPQAAPGAPAGGGAARDQFGRPALTPQWQERLGAIDTVAKRGLANLGQGSLENMTDSELGTFKSGLSYLGRNPDDELDFYKRSRARQGSALGA
jgi:hypothetical protein